VFQNTTAEIMKQSLLLNGVEKNVNNSVARDGKAGSHVGASERADESSEFLTDGARPPAAGARPRPSAGGCCCGKWDAGGRSLSRKNGKAHLEKSNVGRRYPCRVSRSRKKSSPARQWGALGGQTAAISCT